MIYDIILIAIILLSVFIGLRKGAAKTLLSIAAILVSISIALVISRPLSEFLYDAVVKGSIEDDVRYSIALSKENEEGFKNPVSSVYVSAMSYFGQSKEETDTTCNELVSEKGIDAAPAVVDVFRPAIVSVVSVVITLILFLILSLVFGLIAKAISKIFRLPFINFADKLAGALLGLLRGVLTVLVIAFLLKLFAPVISSDSFFSAENISTSSVFSYIYNGGLSATIQSFIYN